MFNNNDNQQLDGDGGFIHKDKLNLKKYLPFIITIFVVLILVLIIFLVFSRKKEEIVIIEEPKDENEEIISTLPQFPGLQGLPDDSDVKVDSALDDAVEFLSFIEFYKKPTEVSNLNYLSYELPLDIKTEVLNYYELNRKINLDSHLNDLSNNGFSKLNNPWPAQADDFYSAYNTLLENQIPIFISSDFLMYHYNLVLKKVWQEIENSFFFNSLWEINLHLFNNSKISYENYLAQVGRINDPILEAKRLRLAYFAVTLELLKPQENQIEVEGAKNNNKFSLTERRYLDYDLPDYLETEVLTEANLIRRSNEKTKSPIFLYERDYQEFNVPRSYRQTARKNNYFLASVWLSSLFPLNYQSEDCPNCLLDINDWRINFTAASLISQDIANSQYLRAEWARIYKIMSFFSGLEDTLTYIYFMSDYNDLFADENIVDLFSLENENALENIENYRQKLLTNNFKEIQGGINFSHEENQALLGFRILARPHWPIDYLNEKLTFPNVGEYLDNNPKTNNVSACNINGAWQRCLSFFGDSLNLLDANLENDYFIENVNYQDYIEVLNEIELSVDNALNARNSVFWSQLASLRLHLNTKKTALPVFAQNRAWNDRLLFSSGASLVDWQMPADNFKRLTISDEISTGLNVSEKIKPKVYIEPALNLINDLLANTQMLSKMFSALGADNKSSLAMVNLDALYSDLAKLAELSENSVAKQNLSQDDKNLIINWLSSYEISDKANKRIVKSSATERASLTHDLNELEFLAIVFPTENGPTMALSPIFNLKESR